MAGVPAEGRASRAPTVSSDQTVAALSAGLVRLHDHLVEYGKHMFLPSAVWPLFGNHLPKALEFLPAVLLGHVVGYPGVVPETLVGGSQSNAGLGSPARGGLRVLLPQRRRTGAT